MSLLSELLADTRPPANSANSANPRVADAPPLPKISKLAKLARVQDSSARQDTVKLRTRMLELANLHGIDSAIVHALPESELREAARQFAEIRVRAERRIGELLRGMERKPGNAAGIGGKSHKIDASDAVTDQSEYAATLERTGISRQAANRDDVLLAYLHMLADDAERKAGRVPKGGTASMLCRHCGPVYVHPSIAAVLPVVGGWPRGLGCPWCFIRPKGIAIPRPHVTCADCAHFVHDAVNPEGMGRCAIDANHGGTNWPHQQRQCGRFEPRA